MKAFLKHPRILALCQTKSHKLKCPTIFSFPRREPERSESASGKEGANLTWTSTDQLCICTKNNSKLRTVF
jgi:hypothetical protein